MKVATVTTVKCDRHVDQGNSEIDRMNAQVELADRQARAEILNWIDETNGKRDGLSGREDRPFSHRR
ncbi:hypothetical protein RIdsm_04738 [Roseovarius indicus]|uniref:Uncharacterized protein n=1 Tax=Roseovarius indicus TaxID=540747 RepID=A0A0T5PFM0_9RHOB|nr:hypothetical protein [Roseovarius indicus]KRS19748.1 hypothetical protein XM52_02650 [Roseovarius indicus]QEW28897.1 hypothetical protein RIdsm_04738 [Roseovarius indicus]SFD82909.1 hypothetical protein SAMN04488031_102764 [Roseovarius indicus]